jgi:hypothetical protein
MAKNKKTILKKRLKKMATERTTVLTKKEFKKDRPKSLSVEHTVK